MTILEELVRYSKGSEVLIRRGTDYNVVERPLEEFEGFYAPARRKTIEVVKYAGAITTKHCFGITDIGSPNSDKVVVSFPGSPISEEDYTPTERDANAAGARVLIIGRPGYPESTPQPGRMVNHAAEWAEDITQALDIETFTVLGRSGGGPHALACAALLPGRVKKAVALSSVSPFFRDTTHYSTSQGQSEKKWISKMSAGNEQAFQEAFRNTARLFMRLSDQRQALLENPYALLHELYNDPKHPLPQSDRNILMSRGNEGRVAWAHYAAVKDNVNGWFHDACALANPNGWGFNLGSIVCPTIVVGQRNDRLTPEFHAKQLVDDIGENATLIMGNGGHFASIEATPMALEWLVADNSEREQVALNEMNQHLNSY